MNEKSKMDFMEEKVYKVLNDYDGKATRPTICIELYDSRTAHRTLVYETLERLEKMGKVERRPLRLHNRGRPEVEWFIPEGKPNG